MKKGLLLFMLLSLLPYASWATASSAPTRMPIPEPSLMPPPPPPSVGTAPPEIARTPQATKEPINWIQAGPVAFDAGMLSIDERVQIIQQLQIANLRSSLADASIVAGLETTRDKPCFIGQSARFRQTLFGDKSEDFMVTMTLVDVLRGEAASAIADRMAAQVYSSGNGLTADMEYVVCTFDISMTANNPNLQALFTTYDFQVISSNGRAITQPILLAGDESYLTLLPGGSGTLRVVLAVEKGTSPVILYLKTVWFSMLAPA